MLCTSLEISTIIIFLPPAWRIRPCMHVPQRDVIQLQTQAPYSLLTAFYGSKGYGGDILTRIHRGKANIIYLLDNLRMMAIVLLFIPSICFQSPFILHHHNHHHQTNVILSICSSLVGAFNIYISLNFCLVYKPERDISTPRQQIKDHVFRDYSW